MSRRLVILYEDARGPLQRFPLHELVVKSAADLVPLAIHQLLQRVVAVPKKGVHKVLDHIAQSDASFKGGTRVLAWVDNDRIRHALQLPPHCARAVVISTIKARGPAPDGARPGPVEVFLLDDNLEGLLSSISSRLDPALLAKACAKRLDARDILLDEIGRSSVLRAALRVSHAGFDCVSRFVGCVAATEPWPPA